MEALSVESGLKSNDKRYKNIIWICCILYTLSVICKGIYASSLIEVVDSMKITKAEAGYVITAYYITYALGQFVFGKLSKVGNSALKIGLSLIASAVLLVIFVACNSLVVMIIIWGIHGLVQAVVWPSVVELQSKYLPDKLIESSAVIIASGLAFATVISYIICSFSVLIYSWKLAFYFMAVVALACGILTVLFFTKYLNCTQTHEKEQTASSTKKVSGATTSIVIMFVFESLLIIIVSYLRHSITNWLPNMISDVFSVASYFSIIMTVAVAILSLFGSVLAKLLHKYINNYILIIALASVGSIGCLALLRFFYGSNMILSVALSSLIVMFTACMNVVLVSVIPLKMRDVVSSGNFSAIMNAFASGAVAVTTTLSGAIIDSNGGNNWQGFYDVGIIFILVNLVVSIIASIFWQRKMVKLLDVNKN